MISFDALKSEVIARLGNRLDIDDRVERWINHAFFELLLNPRFSFYELDDLALFNTVANTRSYNILDPAPDLWFILDLRDDTNSRKLRRSHWQVFDKITETTGQPTRYAHFNNFVELDPTPDAVYLMQLRFRHRPSDLTSGSTFEGIGNEWEEVLAVMSCIKGFEALDQRDKATEQRQLLELLFSTREDVNQLEDMDSESTLAPAIRNRY